jgi:hypothetical protein
MKKKMTLQSELAELEKNPSLLKMYANDKCKKCWGRGYQTWIEGTDVFGDSKFVKRTCGCVIKSLKKDMKNNG